MQIFLEEMQIFWYGVADILEIKCKQNGVKVKTFLDNVHILWQEMQTYMVKCKCKHTWWSATKSCVRCNCLLPRNSTCQMTQNLLSFFIVSFMACTVAFLIVFAFVLLHLHKTPSARYWKFASPGCLPYLACTGTYFLGGQHSPPAALFPASTRSF